MIDATIPPKVHRAMKVDPADGLPVIGSTSSSELGVRPGIDISIDAAGDVVLNGSGMSVAPGWRQLDYTRIPRRLKAIWPGAAGPNATACFSLGFGPFLTGEVAEGLMLHPDASVRALIHGVIAPMRVVPLIEYLADLAGTRRGWMIDER